IFRLFEAHGIPAIPFKGPTLAVIAYGDLALRQFADLDILIRKKDLPRAKEVLFAHGYQHKLTAAQETARYDSRFHRELMRSDDRGMVELHWALTGKHSPFPFDFERLQARLIPVVCGGVTFQSFPPEELLLFLCVHGARHQWERLMWLC